jgi:hypothetical protein
MLWWERGGSHCSITVIQLDRMSRIVDTEALVGGAAGSGPTAASGFPENDRVAGPADRRARSVSGTVTLWVPRTPSAQVSPPVNTLG